MTLKKQKRLYAEILEDLPEESDGTQVEVGFSRTIQVTQFQPLTYHISVRANTTRENISLTTSVLTQAIGPKVLGVIKATARKLLTEGDPNSQEVKQAKPPRGKK